MESIGIIGMGSIGLKLVEYFAEKGFFVFGITHGDVGEVHKKYGVSLDKKVKYEKIPMQQIDGMNARVVFSSDYALLKDCTLVIESVKEDFDIKLSILSRLRRIVDFDRQIVCSTTSSISLDDLTKTSLLPVLIGLHFFNPPTKMKLIEVAFSGNPTEFIKNILFGVLNALDDKVIIEMPAVQGYVVNRILFTQINYAIRFMYENKFEPGIIDRAMKAGTNSPMGPIELSDYIGNDVSLQILTSFWKASGDPVYKPASELERAVLENRLGRKTGIGFYVYK